MNKTDFNLFIHQLFALYPGETTQENIILTK